MVDSERVKSHTRGAPDFETKGKTFESGLSFSTIEKKIRRLKDYSDQRSFVMDLEDQGFKVNGGNTYNNPDESLYDTWETAVVQKKNEEPYGEGMLVAWKHLGGDVRGNYSDKPLIVISDELSEEISGFEPDPSYLSDLARAINEKDLERFKKAYKDRDESFSEGSMPQIFGKDLGSWDTIQSHFKNYARREVGKELDLFRVDFDWGLYMEQRINGKSISTPAKEAARKGSTIPIYI
jgi:hypothetical protein